LTKLELDFIRNIDHDIFYPTSLRGSSMV